MSVAGMPERPLQTEAAARTLIRQALYLEYLSIAWGLIEAGMSIYGGVASGSIALFGFGLDSLIEVFASMVVIWQIRGESEFRRRMGLRLIGVTFFLLAVYVFGESVRHLAVRAEAENSVLGMVVTALAVLIMPSLAVAKRRVGQRLSNSLLVAEAAESTLCALLAGATLLGLLLNAAFGWWWADPVAAIVISLLAIQEGWEAWTATG